ncbi:MAG: ribosome maturation factor RimP [Clostridia bacterium]|nr:ribosome maturation factor RimP [Clostridia bacterium]
MAKVKEICEEKFKPIIEELGYELIEVSYKKEFDGMNLIFTIDRDEGITIEDCEKVNREIDPIIDELNPTMDEPYTLIVSSPGIDRPLKTERDFKRNLNKEISISLFSKINGEKKFNGTLESYSDTEVTIKDSNGNLITLQKDKIANIEPIIKF